MLDTMLNGIVVKARCPMTHLPLDQAAAAIAVSGIVTTAQLRVTCLSHKRVLVLLPPHVLRDDVVAAIPTGVWDSGLSFNTYSPLTDSSISIPRFKLWIDIEGVPPELQTEAHLAQAISSFGLYLGSMEPAMPGDCRTWSIFLATDDLGLVPHELYIQIGGMIYKATIHPRKWIEGQVYTRSDLPPAPFSLNPPSFDRPQLNTPAQATTAPFAPLSTAAISTPLSAVLAGSDSDDDNLIPVSLTALMEIFRDFPPSDLPTHLSQCLAENIRAIRANRAASAKWEYRREERRIVAHFTQGRPTQATRVTTCPTQPPAAAATPDPNLTAFTPHPTSLSHSAPYHTMQPATLATPNPPKNAVPHPSCCSPRSIHDRPAPPPTPLHRTPLISNQPPTTATVHPRPQSTPPDLPLQLCPSDRHPLAQQHDSRNWDPHVLFPEISAPTSPDPQLLLTSNHTSDATPERAPNPKPKTQSHPPTTPSYCQDKDSQSSEE